MLRLVCAPAARRKMCSPCVPSMDLNGNANFQVEFWELGVGWITRPDDIPLLDEQPGARVDRGGEVLIEGMFDLDSTYEAARGGALGVRSNQGK